MTDPILPDDTGSLQPYRLTGTPLTPRVALTYTAFSAAHEILAPMRTGTPWDGWRPRRPVARRH